MKDALNKLLIQVTKLLGIKSLVTIALTIVFCRLAVTGQVTANDFETVFIMVVTFYFGTQYQRAKSESAAPAAEQEEAPEK